MNAAWRSYSLCATLLQVGKDTQTLKEPVTRWHRAAWSHLYCRDTTVVLVPHSADSVASFVASGVDCLPCFATPAFTAILLYSHVSTDKTNKSRNRYLLLSSHLPPGLCSLFLLLLRYPVFQSSRRIQFMCSKTKETKNTQKSPQCACS